MTYINNIFENFQAYIFIGIFIAIILLLILIIVALKSITRLESRFMRFTRGTDKKSLQEMVMSYLDKIDDNKKEIDILKEENNILNNRINNCIQKKSIIRYKAFDDVGSDLSFSVALLDKLNNGVILTGIYGRSDSVVYAKPVDRGISRYELSNEEKQVLNEAMNK